jgi:outer membrane protein, heavy metal efflux system
MVHLIGLIFFIFCISVSSNILGANVESSAILDDLIATALENNPDLKAAQLRFHVYENKIIPAGSLSDPSLSLAFSNYPVDSFAGNEFAMSGKIIKLSQALPFPGKLAARKETAAQQARWYQGQFEDSKLQLTRQVKDTYYSFYYFNKAVSITENNIRLLDDFTILTEKNYEVGKGLQQDVLKAHMERSKLMDRLYSIKQQRDTAEEELKRLLNTPSRISFSDLPDFEITPVDLPLDQLQQSPETERPMYAAFQALVKSYESRKKLARLEYKPDFKIGASYSYRESNFADDGTDFAGIEFSINLPFFRKKREAAVAEASAGTSMALAQYNNFRSKVLFNINDAYNRLNRSRSQALLYKNGIIPQARQAFESALTNYQVGKVGFLVLLDSLKTVYDYELEYYKVLSEGERNIARLEAETGLTFNSKYN